MTTAYLSHPDCLKHEMMPMHPECPERVTAIEKALEKAGILSQLQIHEAPRATLAQLQGAHDAAYVKTILEATPKEGLRALDPDTAMNLYTVDAALRAAGAVVHAVDLVMRGNTRSAFCNVRPPGHHAEHHRAMGFCFFNNIAIGAKHALEAHGVERVAILDFDVHHGNGTADIVRADRRVLFCSSFQHPFYPYSTDTPVAGHLIYSRLPAGTDSAHFRAAIIKDWLPALETFKPAMIFISAGFDAHRDDPLGGLRLDENDYHWVTEQIVDVAKRHANGRIVSSLEGGYNLQALGRSAVAHVRALMNA
jgi:acetoin utilization deacetylase AcuC-like enzyme